MVFVFRPCRVHTHTHMHKSLYTHTVHSQSCQANKPKSSRDSAQSVWTINKYIKWAKIKTEAEHPAGAELCLDRHNRGDVAQGLFLSCAPQPHHDAPLFLLLYCTSLFPLNGNAPPSPTASPSTTPFISPEGEEGETEESGGGVCVWWGGG